MKSAFLLFLATLPLAAEQAVEHVVEAAPFEVKVSFEATFLPQKATVYELQPETWSNFQIKSVVPQGAQVKKDDLLIAFEDESFQLHNEGVQAQIIQKKLVLDQAKQDLAELSEQTPVKLALTKMTAEREAENLAYFEKTSRGLAEESAKQGLSRAERHLASAEEELKQLLKMYEEDQIVEETEEIILKNQRESVASAKVNLTATQESTARTLAVGLPRKLEDLTQAKEASGKTLKSAEIALPRAVKLKAEEVAGLEREMVLLEKNAADLAKDNALFTLKAPSDGIVFYGSLADGRWSSETAAKFMKVGGKIPANEPFISLVPSGAPLVLEAFVSQKERLALAVGMKGVVSIKGLEEKEFAVVLTSFGQFPELGGSFRVSMSAEVPATIVPGMKGGVNLIVHSAGAALSIPRNFLKKHPDGTHAVRVKLADGKDEWRVVELGAFSDGKVEITKGLEAGQVVLPIDDNKPAGKVEEKKVEEKKVEEKKVDEKEEEKGEAAAKKK